MSFILQLPKDLQIALTGNLDESFQPVPIPDGYDWLSAHPEPGQSLKSFEQKAHKAVPNGS